MFAKIMRLYAYLYHLILALFLLGLSIVALANSTTLHLDMLPWTGAALTQWLLWGSILGLVSIALAITGIFRYFFPVWTLVVLVLMVRGFLLQPYSFAGKDPFYQTLWIIAGAAIAFLASLTLIRAPQKIKA